MQEKEKVLEKVQEQKQSPHLVLNPAQLLGWYLVLATLQLSLKLKLRPEDLNRPLLLHRLLKLIDLHQRCRRCRHRRRLTRHPLPMPIPILL